MTINGRDIMMLAIGAVAGSITTYFAVKGRLNRKYEDISANEIEEAQRAYNEKLADAEKKISELQDHVIHDTISESKECVHERINKDKVKPDTDYSMDNPMNGFTDYTKYYTGESSEDNTFDIDQEEPKLKPIFNRPYIITDEDLFAVDGDSIVSVDYFMKDQKLVDGPDVIVEKDETVGLNNIKKLVEGDEEVIYVLNPTSELVYEICRVDDYYDEKDNENDED